MSGGGSSRHLAAAPQVGRLRGKAVERQAKPAELVENDPKLTRTSGDVRFAPLSRHPNAPIRSVPIYDEVDASAETIPPVVDGLGGRRLVVAPAHQG